MERKGMEREQQRGDEMEWNASGSVAMKCNASGIIHYHLQT